MNDHLPKLLQEALAPFAQHVPEPARPGTPQAAGVSFADYKAAAKHLTSIPALFKAETLPRYVRKPGETTEQHALRMQVEDPTPTTNTGLRT